MSFGLPHGPLHSSQAMRMNSQVSVIMFINSNEEYFQFINARKHSTQFHNNYTRLAFWRSSSFSFCLDCSALQFTPFFFAIVTASWSCLWQNRAATTSSQLGAGDCLNHTAAISLTWFLVSPRWSWCIRWQRKYSTPRQVQKPMGSVMVWISGSKELNSDWVMIWIVVEGSLTAVVSVAVGENEQQTWQ